MSRSICLMMALVWVAGCQTTSQGDLQARPLGGLMIVCEPGDAGVYIDDQYMGQVSALSRRPLRLPAGPHRIEIRRDGFFSHFAEITIDEGVRQKLAVKLRKEPY